MTTSIMAIFCNIGISSHVMTFEIGAVLPDSVAQAPAYCFMEQADENASSTLAKV
ncbi:hypothetical protein Hanom_Chr09g00780041 [Helianthus anomalus]